MKRSACLLLLAARGLSADNFEPCRSDIQAYVATPSAGRNSQKLVGDLSECLKDEIRDRLAPVIAAQANVLTRRNLFRLIEANRIDKQAGGTGAASGTTSTGSTASTPSLLSFAVESGAVTQSTSGTVLTVRGNALGLSRMLLGNEQLPDCTATAATCSVPAVSFLENTSFAIGFDTSRQSTAQAPTEGSASGAAPAIRPIALLTGGASRVESFQVRYDFFNYRDLRDPQYGKAWRKLVQDDSPARTRLLASAKTAGENFVLADFVLSDAYRTKILTPLVQRLKAVTTEADVSREIERAVAEAVTEVTSIEDFAEKARTDFLARQRLLEAQVAIAKEARKTLSFSVEYNLLRPREQPELSNVNFVLAGSPSKTLPDGRKTANSNLLLSATAGIDVYNELPAAAKVSRLRDVHFAGQIDRRLPKAINGTDAVLSLSGYYQYQADNALITVPAGRLIPGTGISLPGEAPELLGPKGHLGVVQGKFTFQLGESGVRIPIAITWASRSQLIAAPDVRGNVGISFDLDKLIQIK